MRGVLVVCREPEGDVPVLQVIIFQAVLDDPVQFHLDVVHAGQQMLQALILDIGAGTGRGIEGADPDAHHPLLGERVEETGAAVLDHAGTGSRCAPVDAVGRILQNERSPVGDGKSGDGFVALGGILLLLVQPDDLLAGQVVGHVRAGEDIQFRLGPVIAVVRFGVSVQGLVPLFVVRETGRVVPHLEFPGLLVIPDPVAVGQAVDDGIAGIQVGVVADALQIRFLDQEIVDEELAADVDEYGVRLLVDVRERHGLALRRDGVAGRPYLGEFDAVVQHRPFSFPGGRRAGSGEGQDEDRSKELFHSVYTFL